MLSPSVIILGWEDTDCFDYFSIGKEFFYCSCNGNFTTSSEFLTKSNWPYFCFFVSIKSVSFLIVNAVCLLYFYASIDSSVGVSSPESSLLCSSVLMLCSENSWESRDPSDCQGSLFKNLTLGFITLWLFFLLYSAWKWIGYHLLLVPPSFRSFSTSESDELSYLAWAYFCKNCYSFVDRYSLLLSVFSNGSYLLWATAILSKSRSSLMRFKNVSSSSYSSITKYLLRSLSPCFALFLS